MEKIMRSFLVCFVLFGFLIVSLPLYLITLVIKLFSRRACARISQAIIRPVFKMILIAAGAKVSVAGLDNIPRDRAVLFAGNHRSYADIALGYLTLPVLTGFLAKKEIKKVPGLSWWMRNTNCLFLDRKDVRKDLKIILEAAELVKQGYSMFVMPEGTRNHGEDLLPFKDGCFKVAERSDCPVIPVAILGTDDLYELHKPHIRAAKIAIHYGEPIYLDRMERDERKRIGSIVRERLTKMLEEDRKIFEETGKLEC